MKQHIPYECKQPCERNSCPYCDGGLCLCVVCDGAEGTLTNECPGRKLTAEELDAVYAGKLDFRDGKFVEAPSMLVGSHWTVRE